MPVTITVRRLTQESGSEFKAYLSYTGHSRPFQATEETQSEQSGACGDAFVFKYVYCFTHENMPEHEQCVRYMRRHLYPFFLITSAQPAPRAADGALRHSYDKCSHWWGSGTQESGLRNARWYIWRASFQSIVKICCYIFAFAFSLESTADRINRIQMPA